MPDHNGPQSRNRESFNRVAELYDRYRRGYPPEVIDQIVEMAGIGFGSRILQIGPGTGQLTRPLLQRGASVTAVELGHDMAAIAQRNLREFPRYEIAVSSFEGWILPDRPFDAVISATAFHWVDPQIRAMKAAQALRPGGALAAAIYPHHVWGDDRGFCQASQHYYLKWGLSAASNS